MALVVEEFVAALGFDLKNEEVLRRFNDGIEGVQERLEAFAKRAAEIGRRVALHVAAVGTAVTAAFAGAFRFASGEAEKLSKLGDVSDRLGVGVERLQELRHAAEMGGMGVDNFDVALRRFIRRSSEAARGTGAAKDAFKELGVSLKDGQGNLKTSDDLLAEVADHMTKVKEPADRLRLAFKMFDTDGAAMVKVLAEGSDGLRKWAEDARARGLVFSQDEIDKARAYSDEMNLLQKSLAAMRTTMALDLMPVLTRFLRSVNDWYVSNRDLIRQNISLWTERFAEGLDMAMQSAGRFYRAIEAIGGRVGDLFRYLTGGQIDLSTWQALAGIGAVLLRIFRPFTFWLGLAYLILDDILGYMEGAESVFGDFVQWLQEATGASEGLAQVLAGVAGALGLLMIARPLWLLSWLGRLISLAGGAGVVTALATSVRGLAASLLALAGAGTTVGSSGVLGLLARFGLIGAGAAGVAAGSAYVIGRLSEDNAAEARRLATPRDAERDSMDSWRRYRGSGDFTDDMDERRSSPKAQSTRPQVEQPVIPSPFDPSSIRDALQRLVDGAANMIDGLAANMPAAATISASAANADGNQFAKFLAGMENFSGWMDRMSPEAAAGAITSTVNDHRDQSSHVEVNVGGVHVQQAVEAPAAAGRAVGSAVGSAAAQPLARRVTRNGPQ